MRLAFCGLGQMGAPMAERLLAAGHDLVVWNRSPEKTEPFVKRGAGRAASPAEAATDADAVITMVSTPEALNGVVFGPAGIERGMVGGGTLIEMSTVGAAGVRGIARQLPEGVDVIDAPVLGSIPQARDGALQVFVGSSPENFKRFFEVFSALGEPVHIGPFGSGAAMKLVVNSTLGALQLAFGEAMALSDALGLDSSTTLDVLEVSPIGATVQKKREKLESGVFEPNFKLSLAAKDMRLVTEAAGAAGIELLGAAAARAAFEAANDAGLGDCDYSAVAAFLSGRDARPA